MATLLLPCDGSPSALLAVRHAIAEFRRGEVRRVHLLNVQPPFSHYVNRHIERSVRDDFQRERADEELAEARRMFDAARVPYVAHLQVGDKARCIAEAARELHCDRVLIAPAPLIERVGIPAGLGAGLALLLASQA